MFRGSIDQKLIYDVLLTGNLIHEKPRCIPFIKIRLMYNRNCQFPILCLINFKRLVGMHNQVLPLHSGTYTVFLKFDCTSELPE